jgi:hypothetical protein
MRQNSLRLLSFFVTLLMILPCIVFSAALWIIVPTLKDDFLSYVLQHRPQEPLPFAFDFVMGPLPGIALGLSLITAVILGVTLSRLLIWRVLLLNLSLGFYFDPSVFLSCLPVATVLRLHTDSNVRQAT